MVKAEHHQTLGCFFLNHPPLCEFQVSVTAAHPVTRNLPKTFTARDELYLIELLYPDSSQILLTTELAEDPLDSHSKCNTVMLRSCDGNTL
jgi:hypothetical protein